MHKSILFLSTILLLTGMSPCFGGNKNPIGEWIAPRHCYPNDQAYQEARRDRREVENRWIQRHRDREREQNRRDRKTRKLLEKGIISEDKAVDPRFAQEELRQRREREENRKRERKDKACFDMDVVSPIRNRGIYLNELGDVIIDGKLLRGIYMDEGMVSCTVCHRKISHKNIFNHYQKKRHRFFIKLNPSARR